MLTCPVVLLEGLEVFGLTAVVDAGRKLPSGDLSIART
jgi:hypothetical protein